MRKVVIDTSGVEAVLIAGPTASGKSAFALALAQSKDGVIINADSMQVYAEMRVLTARPSPDEEALVPHRLYGHVSARESYSVGRWLDEKLVNQVAFRGALAATRFVPGLVRPVSGAAAAEA